MTHLTFFRIPSMKPFSSMLYVSWSSTLRSCLVLKNTTLIWSMHKRPTCFSIPPQSCSVKRLKHGTLGTSPSLSSHPVSGGIPGKEKRWLHSTGKTSQVVTSSTTVLYSTEESNKHRMGPKAYRQEGQKASRPRSAVRSDFWLQQNLGLRTRTLIKVFKSTKVFAV